MFRLKALTFEELFRKRVWRIPGQDPDSLALQAASMIRASEKPVIIAGGGVLYSDAVNILKNLSRKQEFL